MSFYRYLADHDVHVIDCAGQVDLEVGLARLRLLAAELELRPMIHGHRRLLIDVRHTVWDSEDTHRQLSIVTRRDFGLNAANQSLRAAIVNVEREGPASDNEHWFKDEAAAVAWLCELGGAGTIAR